MKTTSINSIKEFFNSKSSSAFRNSRDTDLNMTGFSAYIHNNNRYYLTDLFRMPIDNDYHYKYVWSSKDELIGAIVNCVSSAYPDTPKEELKSIIIELINEGYITIS